MTNSPETTHGSGRLDAKGTRAFSVHRPGDTEAVLLQVDRVGEEAHTVAAFISEELGGIAKHLSLTRVIDPLRPR